MIGIENTDYKERLLSNIIEEEGETSTCEEKNKTNKQLSNTSNNEFMVSIYDVICEESARIKKIISIRCHVLKYAITMLLNIITLGIWSLITTWYPSLRLYTLYSIVHISEAEELCIYGEDKNVYFVSLCDIELPNINNSHIKKFYTNALKHDKIKTFNFKLFYYYLEVETNTFVAFNFKINSSFEDLHEHFMYGLSFYETEYQKKLFGECDLNIEVDSSLILLYKEFADPFYLFQVFSVVLWMTNSYEKYATVIIITTILSLTASVMETRENLLSIQKLAKYSCDINKIISKCSQQSNSRSNDREIIKCNSTTLVPGDVYEIPDENEILPCDTILISGIVIVNESMLTGESTPIIKAHLPLTLERFEAKRDNKYILYAGTKIVQKRSIGKAKVLGIVLSTGFNTEKGNLIRSILFPKESEFNFKTDSIKYIYFMSCLSVLGFGIALPSLINLGMSTYEIVVKALDLVTTTVPPALPACLGIGISFALARLKDTGILCINRDRVNMAGKINMVVFDKTGTLTEDSLDIYGFRGIIYKKGSFCFDKYTDELSDIVKESYTYYKEKSNYESIEKEDRNKNMRLLYTECLATCHSITKVNGKIIGDPIDIQMFESTGWILNEDLEEKDNYDSLISTYVKPAQEQSLKEKLENLTELDDEDEVIMKHYELGIVRRFDFSSSLQRMSVLVKNSNEPYYKLFVKGSPEKIKELCVPESVPDDFSRILSKYTTKGFRVLALGVKRIKMSYLQSQKIPRESAESQLLFLGLLIVQNKLKNQTTPSIDLLGEAGYKMIMATGDNIYTAISVAKECGLIIPDATILLCEVKTEIDETSKEEQNKLVWNLVDNYYDEESIDLESPPDSPNHGPLDITNKFSRIMGIPLYLDDSHEGIKHPLNHVDKGKKNVEMLEGINIDYIDNLPQNWNEEEDILAVTGKTFETLLKYENLYQKNPSPSSRYYEHHEVFKLVLVHGYIFARMSPENKTQLVEALKNEDFTVCMCGDGANDCGALKAADVGMSLSIEEASIAAHFTSNVPDISCLINLFREGKASLVTSIQCFKYMMLYSLIQFITVILMMIYGSYIADYQFLAIDLFLIIPLAILMSRTTASQVLTHHQPTGALLSMPIILSILLQTVVQFVAQYGILILLINQSWFQSIKDLGLEVLDDDVPASNENSAVFLVSFAQYITTAIIFSMGGPFKNPIYTNYLLCGFMLFSVSFTFYITLFRGTWIADKLDLVKKENKNFSYVILIVMLINFIISFIVSVILVPVLTKLLPTKDEEFVSAKNKGRKPSLTMDNIQNVRLRV